MIEDLAAWVQSLGPAGPVAYVAVYVLACVCLVPASILTLAGGFVFGFARAFVYVSLGASLGAAACFFLGRRFARPWVERHLVGHPNFIAIDKAVAKSGWKIVALSRMCPLLPFNLLNYGYGLTKVTPRQYLAASWIFMIPGTALHVYFGSLARDVGEAVSGKPTHTRLEWILTAMSLAAAVAVFGHIGKLSHREIHRHR